MLGVIFGAAPPKQPGVSQFMSSATINKTLGRLTGAASWAWTWPTERAKKRTNNRFFTMKGLCKLDLLQDLQVHVLEVDEHARVVQLKLDHATLEAFVLG